MEKLKIQWEEEKKYYQCLVEDLKQSIHILIDDFLGASNAKAQFTKYYEKLASLRREQYLLKKDLVLEK